MTRLQAGILNQLRRGPYTTLDLAMALDEPLNTVRRQIEQMETQGLIEWTLDGWVLVRVNEEDAA